MQQQRQKQQQRQLNVVKSDKNIEKSDKNFVTKRPNPNHVLNGLIETNNCCLFTFAQVLWWMY